MLRKRHHEGRLDEAFLERARSGRYNPELDGLVVSALVAGRDEVDAVDAQSTRVALAAIAERTVDREVAATIAELL